ncbi:MAG: phosphonate metabolism protein/1,5-bisphosphokinase (PRPP-forming) PhnN [Cereibacter sp.]
MTGRLICVVGPSGAGKDTLIDAARRQRPDLVIVRRVITRPSALGGEDFDGVTQAEFDRRKAAGAFALDWRAHGLSYGLPAATLALRNTGRDLLVNASRAALEPARSVFPDLQVIRITAPSAVLTERLVARGRETRAEIEARIGRQSFEVPPGLQVTDVRNDGPLDKAIAAFLAALDGAAPGPGP